MGKGIYSKKQPGWLIRW